MSDRRPWRLAVAAGFLFAAGLATALAVASHDPADSPGTVYPPLATPRNLLGQPGAWLSHALVHSLGRAVHVLLAGWCIMVGLLVVGRSWFRWGQHLLGWLLLIPCTAALADHLALDWAAEPAGPGGTVGAWLALWLEAQLQPPGPALVLGGCLLLSAVLAFDVFGTPPWLRGCWRGGRWGLRLLGRGIRGARRWAFVSRAPRTVGQTPPYQAEDQVTAVDDSSEPAIIPIRHHDAGGERGPHAVPAGPSERERFADYELPPIKLLEEAQPIPAGQQDQQLRDRAVLLEKTFTDFGLHVRVVGINTGPVVTQFEVALETGLRVNKVTRLADDIALNLRAPSVRMVAPIPGKNAVGIEVPNELRADVRLKEVILASGKKITSSKIPLFLGKDSEGRPLVHDLADMPHLLIAGTTGTGKSVCMNAIILSMLMTRRPDEVKMIMIDPKGGVELDQYGKVPHLMHPIVTDMKKAEAILAWAVDKMEERYDLLGRARVRNIASYNELKPAEIQRRVAPDNDEERGHIPERLPYVVIFIDEMADLMMMMKKEVEGHVIRLAQKSRAAGIHLVVATQKPTVDVITGLIKSNLPARICFKVANKSDSRVVLDEMGADKLLGKGDMLFLPPGTSNLVRAQGTYASDREIQKVVECLECEPCYAPELIQLHVGKQEGERGLMERLKERDELYQAAIEVILREGRGSVSLLQRALGIGYGRAARLVDFMAEDGIVGGYNGSNAREVLYTPEQWAGMHGSGAGEAG